MELFLLPFRLIWDIVLLGVVCVFYVAVIIIVFKLIKHYLPKNNDPTPPVKTTPNQST